MMKVLDLMVKNVQSLVLMYGVLWRIETVTLAWVRSVTAF